jgi:CRP/FNR family transcriptional regulator
MLIPHLMLMDVPVRTVPAGGVLLQEGTSGTNVFVLREGEVRVTVGEKEITYISERGAVLGEMAVLLGRPRGATVTAVSESSFFVIEDLRSFLRQDPELSWFLLQLLAQRIDEMNTLLTERHRWWHIF